MPRAPRPRHSPAAARQPAATCAGSSPGRRRGSGPAPPAAPFPPPPGPAPTPPRPGTRRQQGGARRPDQTPQQHPRSAQGCAPLLTAAGSAAAPSPWRRGGRSVSRPVPPSLLHGSPPPRTAASALRRKPAGKTPAPAQPDRHGGGVACPGPAPRGPGAARWRRRAEPCRCAAPVTRSFAAGSTGRPPRSTPGRWSCWRMQVRRVPGRERGRAGAGGRRLTASPARVPVQGRLLPRSAACCSPTAPPATSRTAPAASASPTAAGERRRGRGWRSPRVPSGGRGGSFALFPAVRLGREARQGGESPGPSRDGARSPARGRPPRAHAVPAALSAPPQRAGAGAVRGQSPPAASRSLRGPGEVPAGLRGLQDRAAGGLLHPGGTRRRQQVRRRGALGGAGRSRCFRSRDTSRRVPGTSDRVQGMSDGSPAHQTSPQHMKDAAEGVMLRATPGCAPSACWHPSGCWG